MLDYLAKGRGDVPSYKRKPVVYGVGENQFTLLELIPKAGANLTVGERIYVGKDAQKRQKIEKITGKRIGHEALDVGHVRGDAGINIPDFAFRQKA